MIKTIELLKDKFAEKLICLGIRGIFNGTAFTDLLQAGAQRVVTTNTI